MLKIVKYNTALSYSFSEVMLPRTRPMIGWCWNSREACVQFGFGVLDHPPITKTALHLPELCSSWPAVRFVAD